MTVTDEMVERAAQAAFWSDRKLGHHKDDWTWDDIPDQGRKDYRAMARAALAAALNPTGEPSDD